VPAAKLAVTPEGKPDAANVTVPVKFTGVSVIVLVPVPPTATDKVAGAAERVKLGGSAAVTVTATDVVALSEPEVPFTVTVTGLVVTVAEAPAVRVSTSVSDAPAAKLAVTPLGRPVAANVTVPVKPFAGAMVTVLVAVPPWATDTLAGEAESVKLGVPAAGYAVINAFASSEPQPVASSYPACTA